MNCRNNILFICFIFIALLNIVGCGLIYPPSTQFVTRTDEFTGITNISVCNPGVLWTTEGHSRHTHYLLPEKNISENGIITYMLIYGKSLTSCDALHPQEIIFLIDGKRIVLKIEGSNFEIGSKPSYSSSLYCREWAWVSVDKVFFEKFENAKDVKFRIVGTSNEIEYKFDDTYLACYKTFYYEYCNQ